MISNQTFISRTEVKSIGLYEQSTLAYAVLLQVIYIKFYMELENCSRISLTITFFIAITFYLYISLLSGENSVMNYLTGGEYIDLWKYTFLSYKSVLILVTSSIMVVLPDYAINQLKDLLAFRRHNKCLAKLKQLAIQEAG